MDIEIVEFYPTKRDDKKQMLKGTLHVYLPEIKADLRGVIVVKEKKSWYFGMPVRFGTDTETGESVRFPMFSFIDREKNKELIKLIIEKGKDYINKNIYSLKEDKKSIPSEKKPKAIKKQKNVNI
jgi:hypothetical protein